MPFSRHLIVLAITLLAMASPARAEWLKGESEHFIVYGDTSERGMTRYVQKLERFDQVLRLYLPRQSDFIAPRLPVYLVRSNADMREVWPDIPGSVGGFYARGEERIFAMASDDGEGDSVLLHEYAHHYMFQNFTAPYPAWFVEGFAEYYGTADLTPNRVKIGLFSPGRMNSLTGGANAWGSMEALLSNRRTGRGRIADHAFYAQAWALTHYMLGTPERQAMLGAYLRDVAAGGDPVQSMQMATGRTPEGLQADVQSYLSGSIQSYQPQHEFKDSAVVVSRLSPAESDSLWLDLRLARFVAEERRAGNLVEARALAARYPGAVLPARTLAQAHLDMQQPAEAVTVLTSVIEAHPDDAQTLRLLAVSLMDEADAGEEANRASTYARARTLLAQAYQRDAEDYRIYLALARNRSGAPGYPNENDLETLLVARELAPQLPGVSIRAARALMRRGFNEQAIALLRPIANDPHGGSDLGPVHALLSEAYAAAGLAPTSDAQAGDGEEEEDAVPGPEAGQPETGNDAAPA